METGGKQGATSSNFSNTPDVIQNKLALLRDELVSRFVQREQEITAVLAGLLSSEPTLLISQYKPGTAKTLLIQTLADSINGKFFYALLSKFSEPDEILGPISIPALRRGVYERNTEGKLPDAHLAMLDEVFKASSAIRNLLLDIVLNKRVPNGTGFIKIPLLTLYGASNEISTDVEDLAFVDRFTIRVFSSYVSSDAWDELLEKGIQFEVSKPTKKVIMSVEEVKVLQKLTLEVLKASLPIFKNKYLQALSELQQKGIVISDRRKIKILKNASAISVIYLEQQPSLDDLAEALRFSASSEDELKVIEEVIMKVGLSSFYVHIQTIQALQAELSNFLQDIRKNPNPTLNDFQALSAVLRKTLVALKPIPRTTRLLPYIRPLLRTIDECNKELNKIKRALGVDENES